MSDDSHEYDEDALEFIEDERVRIAALHATCPKQIWLQIDPEAEQFDGWDAQTWCSDKINETDVRYVLAASRDAEIAELKYALGFDWENFQASQEALRENMQLLSKATSDRAVLLSACETFMSHGVCEVSYYAIKDAIAKARKPT